MKRLLLSIVMVVIGLSAFSQSPDMQISFTSAYPLAIGEHVVDDVKVTSGIICLEDVPIDSLPHYEIQEIGPQSVTDRNGGLAFYVTADSLDWQNVTFSCEVEDSLSGVLNINEQTGLFSYYPDTHDCKSFIVKFIASNGTDTQYEDVLFALSPVMPTEADAFNTHGTMPDAGDYTIVAVSSKTMMLNHQEREARSVSISGKDVTFDDALHNKVWGLNGSEDIYELNIYAERMVVRSTLKFPQTNITVYARDLVFEDKGSEHVSINTTPTQIGTKTDGAGQNGANAGNIKLYVKNIKGNQAIRFILDGADGQDCNNNGTPGNGGNGGNIYSTLDISQYCDWHKSKGGTKYDTNGIAIASGTDGTLGASYIVGNSNSYIHPYYISAIVSHANDAYINNQTEYVTQTLVEWRKAIEEFFNPQSNIPLSEDENGKHEGIIDDMDLSLLSSRRKIDMSDLFVGESSSEIQEHKIDLQNLALEMDNMLLKLEQGLDYFGHTAGWVPLLSFEVMKANYENEIERSMPTFYTYYWLTDIDRKLSDKVAACQNAIRLTEQSLESNQATFNSLVDEIPELQEETELVSNRIKNLTKRIDNIEKKLLKKAKKKVKRRNRWKKFFGIAKGVATVALQFVPGGTALSVGLNAAATALESFGVLDWDSEIKSLQTINDPSLASDIGKAISDVRNASYGNYLSTLVSSYESLSSRLNPLISNVGSLYKVLTKKTTTNSQVQAEYNRLIASSKSWKNMMKEVEQLNTQKTDLTNRMDQVFSDMTSTAAEMTSNIIALDAFRRDAFVGNSKRDLNAMIYIDKMRQNAKGRLLEYDYFLRKAYEYRLLRPYEGDYNLVGMFDRFEELAMNGDSIIDVSTYSALSSVFRDRISDITHKIITEYGDNKGQQAEVYYTLNREELDAINTNGNLTLNFHEAGRFLPNAENIRILNLSIDEIETHATEEIDGNDYIQLMMTHSGISQFRKDGKLYWFDHMSHNTESPHTWKSDYYPLNSRIIPHQPSAESESLLRSLLGNNNDNIMLFSRPSAWSDINITKDQNTHGRVDVVIDKLVLKMDYDYTHRPNNIINIDITANEQLLPYITCSEEDINGRSNGRGKLYRSYKKNNEQVTFTAVDQYEMYHFVNWTDRTGKEVSTNPSLKVTKSQDQFYTANYERRGPVLNVPDTVYVSNAGGSYKVKVRNTGYKGNNATEMDWYVFATDSLNTMLTLDEEESEGVDDGSFTFNVKANKTGKDRIDELEIIAPETDEFIKTIYIKQTETFPLGDVNKDRKVDISDIVAIINTIAGDSNYKDSANVNGDNNIDISDIVAVINIIAQQ